MKEINVIASVILGAIIGAGCIHSAHRDLRDKVSQIAILMEIM
jgi:outer membrane murein-binding lipoprotein Lpp